MLNLQCKIIVFSIGIMSCTQADQILFKDFCDTLLPLLQQCQKKAETFNIDCELLNQLEQQIHDATATETMSSQLAVQEFIADITQTPCKIPTVHEAIIPVIASNITRLLVTLTYATTRGAKIIDVQDDPHIEEYRRIFTRVLHIAQRFFDIQFMTDYGNKKDIRCVIADLVWEFGGLRSASKELIKNSQG